MSDKEILAIAALTTALIVALYCYLGEYITQKNKPAPNIEQKTTQDNLPNAEESIVSVEPIEPIELIEPLKTLPARPIPTTLLTDYYWVIEWIKCKFNSIIYGPNIVSYIKDIVSYINSFTDLITRFHSSITCKFNNIIYGPDIVTYINSLTDFIIWFHGSISVGGLVIVVPVIVRVLSKLIQPPPVYTSFPSNMRPWRLHGPITLKELAGIMSMDAVEERRKQSEDTSKSKNWLKLNPLPLGAVSSLDFCDKWEHKPCYILTQGNMWPLNLDRRSLLGYNTLYETLIVPTTEGEAKLRRWRSNPMWCEDHLGSYKNLYVLNNDTNSIVIEYMSGKVVIVQGNKQGGPIIQGDMIPSSSSAPLNYRPLPPEFFDWRKSVHWTDLWKIEREPGWCPYPLPPPKYPEYPERDNAGRASAYPAYVGPHSRPSSLPFLFPSFSFLFLFYILVTRD